MATYQDLAVSEYDAKVLRDQQAADAAKAAFITSAQNALTPVFTDSTPKLVTDPTKVTRADYVDMAAGLCVLTLTDGSTLKPNVPLSFAVYPNRSPVERYIVTGSGSDWTVVAPVADLDDVGKIIKNGGTL